MRMRVQERIKPELVTKLDIFFRQSKKGMTLESLIHKEPEQWVSDSTSVQRLQQHSIDLLKLIRNSWQTFQPDTSLAADQASHVVSPELFYDLIVAYHDLRIRLESHFKHLESSRDIADSLHETVQELLFSKKVTPKRIKETIGLVTDEVANAANISTLFPEQGVLLEDVLFSKCCALETAVYARGIQTARILAKSVPQYWFWKPQYVPLMAAALLQDIGLLIPNQTRVLSSFEAVSHQQAEIYKQHASMGAGLVGAIQKWSIDFPSLVAKHHAHSNARPYGRLSERKINRYQHVLVVGVRLSEIVDSVSQKYRNQFEKDQENFLTEIPATRATLDAAGQFLWEENEVGNLDSSVSKAILTSMGIGFKQTQSMQWNQDDQNHRVDQGHDSPMRGPKQRRPGQGAIKRRIA